MNNIINIAELRRNTDPRVVTGLIAPAIEVSTNEALVEHSAQPIKSLDDIDRISNYLIKNGRYRDNMLFIVGINFGLRVSDLKELRFSHLINDQFVFRDTFAVFEHKTRNTRKRKKNRYVTINNAVMDAVSLYLAHTSGVSLSDYMFRSISNRGGNVNRPLSSMSIDRILKDIAHELNLNIRMSTHTLRKTFCYHQMIAGHNDTRKLMLLQKMLNHSTPAQTLEYIGITYEEIEAAYKELNLGGKDCYSNNLVDSRIGECDSAAM